MFSSLRAGGRDAERRLAAVVALVIAVATACTGSSADQVAAPVGDAIADETEVTVVDMGAVDPDPLQAEILADGDVTHAEMERAVLAVATCLQTRGFTARLDEFVPGEGYELFADAGTEAAAADLDRAEHECKQRLLSNVEARYGEVHRPSEQEMQARHRRFLDCLVDRGYDEASAEAQHRSGEVESRDAIECGRIAEGD